MIRENGSPPQADPPKPCGDGFNLSHLTIWRYVAEPTLDRPLGWLDYVLLIFKLWRLALTNIITELGRSKLSFNLLAS
jgi:hypothetical protein